MAPQEAILVGLFAPLAAALLVPLAASAGAALRDAVGPAAALACFAASLVVAQAVLEGAAPGVTLLSIFPGLELAFRATPAGAYPS